MRPTHDHSPNTTLVETVRWLDHRGVQRGAMGTASTRSGGGMLITPLVFAPETLTAEELVFIARDGGVKGRGHAAADWALHQAIYLAHADVHAVVHAQPPYATALASLERGLPAFHHRVAVAGSDSVPCVPYETPGSPALSAAVVAALSGAHACLVAHDGLVACGASLAQAAAIAFEIEALCHSYLAALAVTEPPRLRPADMALAIDRALTYGRVAPRT